MKKTLSILSMLLIAASFGAVRASAQANTFQSGFFLDNFAYGYRLNPAIMSEKSFIGLGVGNVDATLASDLGLSTLLYPNADGTGLVTGLNNSVSKEQFLSNIKDANNIGLDLGVNILSIGTRRDNKMGTFEINVRADANAALPGDLFRFLKCGSSEQAYDLTDLYLGAKAYAELALGNAYCSASEKFTLGWRVKLLVGLANANVYLEQASITSNADKFALDVKGGARAACAPLNLGTDADGKMTYGFDTQSIKPAGYGAALDLGIKWEPFRNLAITAGINDLGAIQWKYDHFAKSKASAEFNGFSDVDENTNFEEELNRITESLMEITNLTPTNETATVLERLSFTANAGVRYRLPIIRRLSVGALCTYRFDTISPWYDARVGATFTPLNWLSLTANYGQNSNGTVCGGALSLSLLFLNLYVGVDGYSGRIGVYDLEGVSVPIFNGVPYPVDPFRYKVNFGLTMQFGTRRSVYTRDRY